ncbi:MAG TPA: enoyl-CoA hydratase-related protein [Chitinophagales bacterium]|nr:enoyl-CoA hydratase-related protein [Chitinophagales bacterium]
MVFSQEQTKSLSSQTFAYLIVEENEHVLTVTLHRPEKKNAMNPVMMNEIVFALNYAHYNNDVWVVVIKAHGDVFSAGADLKAFAGQADEKKSTIPEPSSPVALGDAFVHLHKPCIAQVHGNVLAGAHLIVCGCTHVIASSNVQFSLPEVKRGIWPMQVMASLAQIMPARQLLDYCMRGKTLSAEEALELGLATQVVEPSELDNAVKSLVDEIKSLSPSAIRLGLKAWDELKNVEPSGHHQFLLKMLQQVLQTEDAAEGLRAFAEKRKPVWKGK